jgi:hypothetical protein
MLMSSRFDVDLRKDRNTRPTGQLAWRGLRGRAWFGAAALLIVTGCGTTRSSDTQRTATEQLLISNAVDQAIAQIDFRTLTGKSVFFDAQYLDGTVDKGYVVSSLRQQLLASGCILEEDRTRATYVVEARSGSVGTDRYSVLVGIPAMQVPSIMPWQPTQIPEIPAAKRSDEQGIAKIAVFAYNRKTGQRAWQSGTVEASSDAKDVWVLGMGPFRKGTILHGTEFAGEEIPNPLGGRDSNGHEVTPVVAPVQGMSWNEPPAQQRSWSSLLYGLAKAVVAEQPQAKPSAAPTATADSGPKESGSADNAPPAPKSAPSSHTPYAANIGGHAAGQ